MSGRPEIAIVGAGPAGLMAAEVAAAAGGARVTIYDRMPSPGRKLLLAGRGGLNLTHGEETSRFRARYGPAAADLAAALDGFGPEDLRKWCAALGIDTFVGSSGRVFPSSFKTSPLLRAWLRRLDSAGVAFRLRHRWLGWTTDGRLRFETPDGEAAVRADCTILALGGASWPQLGSDGSWAPILDAAGAGVTPLEAANCGFVAAWSDAFREKFEGQPLKNVALSFEGERVRGDVVVTRRGLEGGPVYALAPRLRAAIARDGAAIPHVALRPDLSEAALAARFGRRRAKESMSNALRKTLGLAPVAIALLRETRRPDDAPLAEIDPAALARCLNAVPVRLDAPMPLARAISTAGGIRFAGLDENLMLSPGVFVAGEMLDWEAPTGGYLLQACFATGALAGRGAVTWLAAEGRAGAG